MKSILLTKNLLLPIVLVLCAFVYLPNLPQYVQGGDTAELVAAGYRLYVPHPPGYPLWTWLQFLWLHGVSFGSIFWRASLLACLLSLLTLGIIGFPIRKNPIAIFACIPILAVSSIFKNSAILPDVFSLHALFIASIGFFYFFIDFHSNWRRMIIPILFGLGLSNHLTIIFLFPVLIGLFIECHTFRQPYRFLWIGGAIGIVLATFLYGSLLFLNVDSPYSWGSLHTLGQLWNHFLRSDYGTFQLAPTHGGELTGPLGLIYFLKFSVLEIFSLVILCVLFISQMKKHLHLWTWLLSIFISILFLLASNIHPSGMGAEVLERFHLMPLVQVAVLCSWLFSKQTLPAKFSMPILGITVSALIIQSIHLSFQNNLRHDSVFEDYFTNLLNQAGRFENTVILAENDHTYFGLRYIQSVYQKQTQVGVISPSLFFNSWYLKKVQLNSPLFTLINAETVVQTKSLQLEEDLLIPNLEHFSFVVTEGFQKDPRFHITYLGLGRILQKGTGVSFDEKSLESIELRTRYTNAPDGLQSFSRAFVYNQYSYYFLGKGLNLLAQGDQKEALQAWRTALDLVPFSMFALKNLCQVSGGKDPRCKEKGRD